MHERFAGLRHLHESTCTGGLAEAQGSPTHFVNEPGQEGYRGTNTVEYLHPGHVRRIVNCGDWTLRPLPDMRYRPVTSYPSTEAYVSLWRCTIGYSFNPIIYLYVPFKSVLCDQ